MVGEKDERDNITFNKCLQQGGYGCALIALVIMALSGYGTIPAIYFCIILDRSMKRDNKCCGILPALLGACIWLTIVVVSIGLLFGLLSLLAGI
jgi:hypothetical protein